MCQLQFTRETEATGNKCIIRQGDLPDGLAGQRDRQVYNDHCHIGDPGHPELAQPKKLEATVQEGTGCGPSPTSKAWKLPGEWLVLVWVSGRRAWIPTESCAKMTVEKDTPAQEGQSSKTGVLPSFPVYYIQATGLLFGATHIWSVPLRLLACMSVTHRQLQNCASLTH